MAGFVPSTMDLATDDFPTDWELPKSHSDLAKALEPCGPEEVGDVIPDEIEKAKQSEDEDEQWSGIVVTENEDSSRLQTEQFARSVAATGWPGREFIDNMIRSTLDEATKKNPHLVPSDTDSLPRLNEGLFARARTNFARQDAFPSVRSHADPRIRLIAAIPQPLSELEVSQMVLRTGALTTIGYFNLESRIPKIVFPPSIRYQIHPLSLPALFIAPDIAEMIRAQAFSFAEAPTPTPTPASPGLPPLASPIPILEAPSYLPDPSYSEPTSDPDVHHSLLFALPRDPREEFWGQDDNEKPERKRSGLEVVLEYSKIVATQIVGLELFAHLLITFSADAVKFLLATGFPKSIVNAQTILYQRGSPKREEMGGSTAKREKMGGSMKLLIPFGSTVLPPITPYLVAGFPSDPEGYPNPDEKGVVEAFREDLELLSSYKGQGQRSSGNKPLTTNVSDKLDTPDLVLRRVATESWNAKGWMRCRVPVLSSPFHLGHSPFRNRVLVKTDKLPAANLEKLAGVLWNPVEAARRVYFPIASQRNSKKMIARRTTVVKAEEEFWSWEPITKKFVQEFVEAEKGEDVEEVDGPSGTRRYQSTTPLQLKEETPVRRGTPSSRPNLLKSAPPSSPRLPPNLALTHPVTPSRTSAKVMGYRERSRMWKGLRQDRSAPPVFGTSRTEQMEPLVPPNWGKLTGEAVGESVEIKDWENRAKLVNDMQNGMEWISSVDRADMDDMDDADFWNAIADPQPIDEAEDSRRRLHDYVLDAGKCHLRQQNSPSKSPTVQSVVMDRSDRNSPSAEETPVPSGPLSDPSTPVILPLKRKLMTPPSEVIVRSHPVFGVIDVSVHQYMPVAKRLKENSYDGTEKRQVASRIAGRGVGALARVRMFMELRKRPPDTNADGGCFLESEEVQLNPPVGKFGDAVKDNGRAVAKALLLIRSDEISEKDSTVDIEAISRIDEGITQHPANGEGKTVAITKEHVHCDTDHSKLLLSTDHIPFPLSPVPAGHLTTTITKVSRRPLTYIASSRLIQNLPLARALENVFTVRIVERDYGAAIPRITTELHTIRTIPDADLVIDERTAVIYYPLHLLSQSTTHDSICRVLDGARELKSSILNMAWRYERVWVVLEDYSGCTGGTDGVGMEDRKNSGVALDVRVVFSASVAQSGWWGRYAGEIAGLQVEARLSTAMTSTSVDDSHATKNLRRGAVRVDLGRKKVDVASDLSLSTPWHSKEAWEAKVFLKEDPRAQERFLHMLGLFNSISAQALLAEYRLGDLLGMGLQEAKTRLGGSGWLKRGGEMFMVLDIVPLHKGWQATSLRCVRQPLIDEHQDSIRIRNLSLFLDAFSAGVARGSLGGTCQIVELSSFGDIRADTMGTVTADSTYSDSSSESSSSESASDSSTRTDPPSVAYWLLSLVGLTYGIIVLGGLTRLTESGLSITEWNLIKGMKAPSSEDEWMEEFAKYKATPEYKRIFYYEWAHRMWGRAIGLAFLLPFGYFVARGRFSNKTLWRVTGIGGLIGVQGALGWYMVQSGLDPDHLEARPNPLPRVSQYRLAAHLMTAFLVYGGSLWVGLDVLRGNVGTKNLQLLRDKLNNPALRPLRGLAVALAGLVFLTSFSGALVAGLDAGLVYNEWPFMGGNIVPSDMWNMIDSKGEKVEKWRNLVENPSAVQFDHRMLAYTTLVSSTALFAYGRRLPIPRQAKAALHAVMALAYCQAALGIFTLLYLVPIPLASAHQAGSVAVYSAAIWLAQAMRTVPK
ncbi:Cytochrome c oxidase assembly protein cox15 [Gonapodya sp. JEL0774]|nr:Cytochrome c oxidase assembly protein cox15 [Gonapodya sp. JEL0774]